ncbi:hypothetical protein EDB19DRAFT_1830581 [Suillus lakei]|nr:hypothetical protein EDB19DRAFT_1830581 [Suillus lakei]
MDFLNYTCNRTPPPDHLAVNQEVLDDDLCCAFVNPPGSFLCANDMTYNTVPSHPTQLTVGPWTSGDSSSSTDHNHRNFTQGRYSTQSASTSVPQALAIPPSRGAYYHHTTTNMLQSVPDYGSWHNTPTLHTTQYCNPALGGASIGHSSPAMGSDYLSPSTSQMVYPNGHPSRSTISSQYIVANHDTPFVLDPNMTASDFSPYNTSSHQWQNSAVPKPGPPSLPFTPMPPSLAVKSSRLTFLSFISPPVLPMVKRRQRDTLWICGDAGGVKVALLNAVGSVAATTSAMTPRFASCDATVFGVILVRYI